MPKKSLTYQCRSKSSLLIQSKFLLLYNATEVKFDLVLSAIRCYGTWRWHHERCVAIYNTLDVWHESIHFYAECWLFAIYLLYRFFFCSFSARALSHSWLLIFVLVLLTIKFAPPPISIAFLFFFLIFYFFKKMFNVHDDQVLMLDLTRIAGINTCNGVTLTFL